MKKYIITISIFFGGCAGSGFAQNIETAIRNLEQEEVKAVLGKDTVVLKNIWDKDYIVNNPDNKVVLAQANPLARPVLQKARISFTRDVEQILVNGDIVISMGSELVMQKDETTQADKTIKRRYTNIWMKKNDSWKLVARHANVICQ